MLILASPKRISFTVSPCLANTANFLPPLRDRGDDIIEIAYSLLGFMSKEEGKDFPNISCAI